MRLTLVISSLNSGGAERVITALANYWADQGHHISLVTLAHPDAKPFYPLHPEIKLIQLNQQGNTFENSFFKRLKNVWRRVFYLRKTLQDIDPHAVVSFVDMMNIITLLASFGLKKPILIAERTDPNYHHIARLDQWIRLLVYPKAHQLIVQTSSAAAYFPKRFVKFIKIIPNAVQRPKDYKKNPAKKISKIITVGRLNRVKDHQTLLYAFAKLLHDHPHLTLTIYGEGEERSNLERLIVSLGLQGKVHLPGAIKNVHEALMEADLFIFPSKYEGFPNALGEAMAVGLPVIASNCSGNRDIVRDTIDGRLFPIGDVEALTTVALELLNDPAQCQLLATNAPTITERYSQTHIFSLWDQVLLDALNARSS
jgi:Glycosyltransferase